MEPWIIVSGVGIVLLVFSIWWGVRWLVVMWQPRLMEPVQPWRDLHEEMKTLRRAIVVLIEAESDVQQQTGSFHRHRLLKAEDRRQIEVMLGIHSED